MELIKMIDKKFVRKLKKEKYQSLVRHPIQQVAINFYFEDIVNLLRFTNGFVLKKELIEFIGLYLDNNSALERTKDDAEHLIRILEYYRIIDRKKKFNNHRIIRLTHTILKSYNMSTIKITNRSLLESLFLGSYYQEKYLENQSLSFDYIKRDYLEVYNFFDRSDRISEKYKFINVTKDKKIKITPEKSQVRMTKCNVLGVALEQNKEKKYEYTLNLDIYDIDTFQKVATPNKSDINKAIDSFDRDFVNRLKKMKFFEMFDLQNMRKIKTINLTIYFPKDTMKEKFDEKLIHKFRKYPDPDQKSKLDFEFTDLVVKTKVVQNPTLNSLYSQIIL